MNKGVQHETGLSIPVIAVMEIASYDLEHGRGGVIIKADTRFSEDLLWDDGEVEEFIDELSDLLQLKIARPFIGATVGELVEKFERAQVQAVKQ